MLVRQIIMREELMIIIQVNQNTRQKEFPGF